MSMGHLGNRPAGGNVHPELERGLVPVQELERSEPQAEDGGDVWGSSAVPS